MKLTALCSEYKKPSWSSQPRHSPEDALEDRRVEVQKKNNTSGGLNFFCTFTSPQTLDTLPEAWTPHCGPIGQQNPDMDVESAQKSGRRRGGCLDVFLVLSVIFLFVAVTVVAVGGVMVVMELRSKLESARPSIEFQTLRQTGDSPAPAYKMQNFVYLEASLSELKNYTMQWEPVHYGPGKSVGSNFLFDPDQHSLKPKQVGIYFIYVALNFTCTHNCSAGLLRVQVNDQLTCEVELPAVADKTPVSKKCWTVSQLHGQKLLTQMIVPENGLLNWKLELGSSGFGMFLVD